MAVTAAAQPALVYCPHPLLAAAGRRIEYGAFLPGETIAGYLERAGVRLPASQPVYLRLNDVLIPRAAWETTIPRDGDLIVIRARVQGGGGGGKNPLRTILSIAVMVFAQPLAAALLPAGMATQAAFLGITYGQLLGGAISIAGNLLINAILPPPKPNLSFAQGAEQPSPTYSLAGGSNRARPYEPLPVIMGRHRVFPDLGARPYTEFRGDDQYLYQVFNFGISDIALSDFRIGATPLAAFEGVDIEISGDDGRLTLFPANVDTVAGGELTQAAGWILRTSSPDAWQLAVEITGSLFYAGDAGMQAASVTFEIEFAPAGSGAWEAFAPGEITAYHTHYWSAGYYTRVHEDSPIPILFWDEGYWGWIQLNHGPVDPGAHTENEFYAHVNVGDDTIEARWRYRPYSEINGGVQGGPLYDPAPRESYQVATTQITVTQASRKPLRLTYTREVPLGQYDVRVRRISPDATDPRLSSTLVWSQLRTYQPDEADYAGQKRVAVRIKASGQLQGTLDRFSAEAYARTRLWDGAGWTTDHTRNPAWWVLAALRGKRLQGRRAFGCDLAEDRIDLDNLKAFAAWCAQKSLTFDGVFDGQMNCLDMVNAIARCGRGSLTLASGKYGVVWDAPDQPVVAVFGLANIKQDSFRVRWESGKLADEVVVNFWNPELDWQQDSVRAPVPGVEAPAHPVTVELFGCTSKDMAGREANLLAAAQRLRRRFITFETDVEGLVAGRGDVIAVSHRLFAAQQLNAWGASGRLVAGTASHLTLDAPVRMAEGAPNYVGVRAPDGAFHVREAIYAAGEVTGIDLASPLPAAPGQDPMHPVVDYLWFFGLAADGAPKKFKVHEVTPLSEREVRITAVDETPDYYAAESGAYVYTPPAVFIPPLPVVRDLEIAEELLRAGGEFVVQLTLTWETAGVYDHAAIRLGVNGAPLAAVGTTHGRRFEATVPDTGTVRIEITPIHPFFGAGAPLVTDYAIVGKSAPPSDVAGFAAGFDGPYVDLAWLPIPDVDADLYEIRAGTDWETAAVLAQVRGTRYRHSAITQATTFLIKAIDTSGNYSVTAAAAVAVPVPPPALSVTAAVDGPDLRLAWPTPTGGSFPLAYYEVRSGASWETAQLVARVDVTLFVARVDWGGTRRWWVAPVDIAGNQGAPVMVEVHITAPGAPAVQAEVIDNNVLLRWSDARQTLPIAHYEVRRGAEFASATVIGVIQSRFAVIFETAAGQYSYWVAGVDTAGNTGAPGNIIATVDQPPDYVLFDVIDSDFAGSKANALAVDGRLLVMTDPDISYDDSFATESWTSWQDAIDAGFPLYMQPGTTSAQYVEEIDYGAVLPATKVTVDLTTTPISGSVTVTPTISIRKLDTDPWTDFPGQWSVYGTDFQFVKVTLAFTGGGRDDLMFVDEMVTRLDVKLKSDAGTVTADENDAGGTTVPFNVEFIDVHAITGTAQGTTPAIVVIDFTDVPHPTAFKVLVFDLAGSRITREVRWEAKGA